MGGIGVERFWSQHGVERSWGGTGGGGSLAGGTASTAGSTPCAVRERERERESERGVALRILGAVVLMWQTHCLGDLVSVGFPSCHPNFCCSLQLLTVGIVKCVKRFEINGRARAGVFLTCHDVSPL